MDEKVSVLSSPLANHNSPCRQQRLTSRTLQSGSLGYWDRLCRSALHARLKDLRDGRLTVHDTLGTSQFGTQAGSEESRIEILDPKTYRRVVTGGGLGAADAYVDGMWRTDDLVSVLRLFARNLAGPGALPNLFNPVRTISDILRLTFQKNTRQGSSKNIRSHYDLSNEFFSLFLDATMTYSSGVFESESTSLQEASQAKYELICRKIDLRPHDCVLEIGCGWGGFAEYAAKNFGCRVLGVTISKEQYRFAKERLAGAGLTGQVEITLSDYRDLQGSYDKIVSIEMVEAVGHEFLPGYFGKCCSLLRPQGQMLLQGILIPDQRYEKYRRGTDFIQKYIFPGGCLPSLATIHRALARRTDMRLVHMEDFGQDYAMTLKHWRERFHQATTKLEALGFDAQFRRIWEYYFCYCIAGFLEHKIGVAQLLLRRA